MRVGEAHSCSASAATACARRDDVAAAWGRARAGPTERAPSRWDWADAVGAGVAAADHDDVLARGADLVERRRRPAGGGPNSPAAQRLRGVEVLHREVEAGSSRSSTSRSRGTREPIARTTASNSARSVCGVDVDADVHAKAQLDALGHELRNAPLDDPLLDLEIGHTEADQAAGSLVALEDHDRVPCAAQLLGRRETRRAGADDGDPPARFELRRRGTTQPSANARSMIELSICLIVTASPSLISSTQAASHGAGQRRPVNSGKLLVSAAA